MGNDSSSSPIETLGTSKPLDLSEFEPESTLEVKGTPVERPRHPVIGAHAHLRWSQRSKAVYIWALRDSFWQHPRN